MSQTTGRAPELRRLAIIGVGLMGGSLALAARGRWPGLQVAGYDVEAAALEEAERLGVITEACGSAAEAAAGADLVVISTPVRSIPELLRECLGATPAPWLVTDLGSTKTGMLSRIEPGQRSSVIGGHPMCGAETAGVRFARPDLFRGATYFLCMPRELPAQKYRFMHSFVQHVGARPMPIEAKAHDHIMALISHVPHVIANVIMSEVGGFELGGRRALYCAGPSFRDLTRVAGANPHMWREIFLENREALAGSLRAVADDINRFCDALARGDEEAVEESIGTAVRYRQELLQKGDIEAATLYQVTVRIPDQPGLLSRVMTALGDAGVNIEDLTLHHYSRRAGGDLVLYVAGEQIANSTVSLLEGLGYPALAVAADEASD